MPVLVEEIFETYRKKYSLTLLAGESGLKNIARTVYIIEDIETSSFLGRRARDHDGAFHPA